MKIALMQPYFFPYVGYFQLMAAVDCFVCYDDAQYMKGGWINRNRILREGAPAWWTFPVVRDDYRLAIRERSYARDATVLESLRGKLQGAYREAPEYASMAAQVAVWLEHADACVAGFNRHLLQGLADLLGLGCRVLDASQLGLPPGEGGQARVLQVCAGIGATGYLNPIGGRALYRAEDFARAGVALEFLEPELTPYPQFDAPFAAGLSIVDLLMFNPPARARELVRLGRRVAPEALAA